MGREWLKNTLVLLPVFMLMAAASYYLWRDTQPEESTLVAEEKAEVIGVLQEQVSNVKRKLGNSLYWNPLRSNENLYSNDSIRTGTDSSATIQLQDKSSIVLAENSLIVLEKRANQLNVDFKTGDIETKSGSENLSIKVKDTILDSKSAELKLRTDTQNNTQIIVTKGTATLTDKQNKKVDITTKKVVNVDEKGQAKQAAVALVLNTPKDKTSILDPDKTTTYPFTWTMLDDELKEETLEISTKPDFTTITFRKNGHQAVRGAVNRGTQYWRVSTKMKDGKIFYSEVRELRLDEDKRVVNVSPANNSNLDFEPEQDKITFTWNALGAPKVFILEISKDIGFTQMIITQTTPNKTFEASGLKAGKYYWRVRALGENNAETGRTAPFTFQLNRTLAQIPQLLFPENGFVWTLNDPLAFEWKRSEKAHQYQLVISKDAAQSNIVNQVTLKETKYLWKWNKPGEYYWSVTCLNAGGDIVGKSVMHKAVVQPTVSGPVIILKSPADQSTVTRDRRDPMDPIVFSWAVERPISAGPFTFYISEKPDFSTALKKSGIESTRYSLRLDRGANYYWKVEWVNPKDAGKPTDKQDREVSIPFSMKYRINSNLPAPLLIEPLNNTKKSTPKADTVEFKWQKVAGSASYRITLERENPNTKERVPVLSQIVAKESFVSMPLEPGIYNWNVSSLDKDKVEGPASQTRRLIIELNKELNAPKLRAPVVK